MMEDRKPPARRWRIRPIRRFVRLFLVLLLIFCGLLVSGFLYFAETVASMETPRRPQADAIVVLTGGFQRIDQAIDLLKQGAGRRLLISGVNPATSGNQIRRFTQSSSTLFECCVDIGYDAMDTIGNANETAQWISDHGYSKVLVVTNNYHMPRSLLELRRSDKQTEFLSYPVINSDLKNGNWLGQPMVMKAILSEYFKYSAAVLRDIVGAGTASGLRRDEPAHASLM
ncbi:YdcF family protein [Rhizobium sp. ARZ01]|nr:YdcF family protein [Rhizobium sp. ARZ01]